MATAAVSSLSEQRVAMFPVSPDHREALLADLRKPFEESQILWRVAGTSRDKKKGRVVPYADKRSYTDRLNTLFTPAGWTDEYSVTSMSPIQRSKKDKLINTGKLMASCTVTIHGLGSHTSTGEEWADDENAMTRAEAQAFKRACSEFGLGRYFYDVAEVWVDLNEYGEPKKRPSLSAILAAGKKAPTATNTASSAGRQTTPPKDPQSATATTPQTQGDSQPRTAPAAQQRTAQPNAAARPQAAQPVVMPAAIVDPKVKARISSYSSVLGTILYADIVRNVTAKIYSGDLKGELGETILLYMDKAARKLDGIREAAGQLPDENAFYAILDQHQVKSLAAIPTYNTLLALAKNISEAVAPSAAG